MTNLWRWMVVSLILSPFALNAAPFRTVDLADVAPNDPLVQRAFGSVGDGRYGVPVAGGFDMDGDGHRDYAFSAMIASPLSRSRAGQVFLIFGDGTVGGSVDTAVDNNRVLPILGGVNHEHAGSEIWMGDVTGDGLGDLIICRQDYSDITGNGRGAMTILPGNAMLKTLAETSNGVIDLNDIDPDLAPTTVIGANPGDRLCMWARTVDITGDGTDDLAVSADQEDSHGLNHSGAVYVFRGGEHLNDAGVIDLADFGTAAALPGNILRVKPPADPGADVSINGQTASSPVPVNTASEIHFGATLNIAALDSNPGAALIIAASLNRAGGALSPTGLAGGHGSRGTPQGTLYILWQDNFSGNWDTEATYDLTATAGPGAFTIIDGGIRHTEFGEEILGGLDYDNDGNADLFIGDLTAFGLEGVNGTRVDAGTGHIFYQASDLKNRVFDYDSTPSDLYVSSFIGPVVGAISGDTAMHGDFNCDGIDDLATSSPHDNQFGRTDSGTLHVLLGRNGQPWPETMDFATANFPRTRDIKIINIHGANGTNGLDKGDTLSYSGTAGDLDKDGCVEIITNEMVGNGVLPSAEDTGNLLIINGKSLSELSAPPAADKGELCIAVPRQTAGAVFFCL